MWPRIFLPLFGDISMPYPSSNEGNFLPSHIPVSDILHGGFVDYNDSTTPLTPLVVTGGGGDIVLTNDQLGPFTQEGFLPSGVTSIWDPINNQFDFSQLKLGDTIEIRLEVFPTTVSPNSTLEIDLILGIGGNEYPLTYVNNTYKDAGPQKIDRFSGGYMGDNNTLLNPAEFRVRCDGDATVIVSGWYVKITRKG